jgi:hypothetical protein
MGVLIWIENSGVGVWIRESLWGYPIVLSCHAVGMAIVVGTFTMVDIRVLGFAGGIPITACKRLLIIGWLGFLLNLVSGCLLFTGDAQRFFFQGVFEIKMGLIILGGLTMWYLVRTLKVDPESARVKYLAALSLAMWFGAIIAGRLTAYIGAE